MSLPSVSPPEYRESSELAPLIEMFRVSLLPVHVSQRREKKLRFRLGILLILAIFGVLTSFLSSPQASDDIAFQGRHMLSSSSAPMWEQCHAEKENTALFVTIYALLTFHLFVGIAIICDDHFVPALEAISEKLQLSEDVAGATFMAAGLTLSDYFGCLI